MNQHKLSRAAAYFQAAVDDEQARVERELCDFLYGDFNPPIQVGEDLRMKREQLLTIKAGFQHFMWLNGHPHAAPMSPKAARKYRAELGRHLSDRLIAAIHDETDGMDTLSCAREYLGFPKYQQVQPQRTISLLDESADHAQEPVTV